jgi:hypothetical protein
MAQRPVTLADIVRGHVSLEIEGFDRLYFNGWVPALRWMRSPRASGQSRRFPADVQEFEPEVLDSPQEAVQSGLVGSSAPQHRRIARRAHRHVVEGFPHRGARDTANGDHVGATGHLSRAHHLSREPRNRVNCRHPVRVRRPGLARAGTRDRAPGTAPGGTFVPGIPAPAVIGWTGWVVCVRVRSPEAARFRFRVRSSGARRFRSGRLPVRAWPRSWPSPTGGWRW